MRTGEDHSNTTYSAEDIRRYLKGEMSPEEMYLLEKAALEDPFLADAIEGWQEALVEHGEEAVNREREILRRRLAEQSGDTQKAAVVRFPWFRVAAAVILVAGAAALAYQAWIRKAIAPEKSLAVEQKASASPQPSLSPPPPPAADTIPAANSDAAATPGLLTDSTREIAKNELPPPGKSATPSLPVPRGQAQSYTLSAPSSQPDTLMIGYGTTRKRDTDEDNRLEALAAPVKKVNEKVPGLAISPSPKKAASDKGSDAAQKNMTNAASEIVVVQDPDEERKALSVKTDSSREGYLFGRITGIKDEPLANATLDVPDYRPHHFVTDRNGYFKIPDHDTALQVGVTAMGYDPYHFTAGNRVVLNQVRLRPSDGLGETLKASRKFASRAGSAPVILRPGAEPEGGWDAYKKYLDKNKQPPEDNPDVTGEVIVTFTVNKKGRTSHFIVDKSLGSDYDDEAIRLIGQGPRWKLVNGGSQARITVVVHF